MRKQASIQGCFGSHSPCLLLPSVMNIAFSLWHSEAGLSKLISILLHFNEPLCISVIFFLREGAIKLYWTLMKVVKFE